MLTNLKLHVESAVVAKFHIELLDQRGRPLLAARRNRTTDKQNAAIHHNDNRHENENDDDFVFKKKIITKTKTKKFGGK